MVTSAPSRSRARKCVSTRRRPMTSPPGGGRLTRPKRASIGPARRIEARMRAHSTGSSSRGSARAVFTSTAFGPSQRTSAPRCASNASIVSATRLPPVRWRHATSFDLVLTAGGPLVVLGLVLGPGIDLINRSVLAALAPVTALAIGWIGAALGARFEWRYVRRIGRGTWLLAALSAVAAFAVVALGAWLLTRVVPSLSAAWTPRLPALLTLGAVAAASGPGAVTLVARAVGVRKSVTRAFSVAAALETAGGALAFTLPLALHRAHPLGGHVAVGWLAWLVFALASGALVGTVFLALTRQRSERADVGFVLLATLLFGAGVGYAADLSPFLVCALASALIVNASPRRQAIRQVRSEEHTSELQSRLHLVCRLLLEKKKR